MIPAVSMAPKRASVITSYSIHYTKLYDLAGDKAKAKRYYQLAIGYNPRKPKALLELAALALDGGEPAEANRALSQYQRNNFV